MDWQPAIELLERQGFREAALPGKSSSRVMVGSLATRYGEVKILLELDDKCVDAPTVVLSTRPTWLPRYCGHLTNNGILCYVDSEQASPNRRLPAELVTGVLAATQRTLENLVDAGGQVDDEFSVLWSTIELGVIPSEAASSGLAWCRVGGSDGQFFCLLDKAQQESIGRVAAIKVGALVDDPIRVGIRGVPVTAGPGWPIGGLGDLLDWLGYVDARSVEEVRRQLMLCGQKWIKRGSLPKSITFLLESPRARFGLSIDINSQSRWVPTGRQFQFMKPTSLVGLLSKRRGHTGDVLRFTTRQMNTSSLLERTFGAGQPTLAGQKVVLVGAGSVGSFLADALVRSGAGSEGGMLKLVDNDHVGIENLARAQFVFADVGVAKANALAARLVLTWQDLNVIPIFASAESDEADVMNCDILVDASGDYGLSCWLSERCNFQGAPLLLSTWIVGAGQSVQSYLQSERGQACLSCVDPTNPQSQWSSLVTQSDTQRRVGACGESFMPYSVSAPMIASGLAIAHLLDWLKGTGTPVMRTIVLGPAAKGTSIETPTRCRTCPAP